MGIGNGIENKKYINIYIKMQNYIYKNLIILNKIYYITLFHLKDKIFFFVFVKLEVATQEGSLFSDS